MFANHFAQYLKKQTNSVYKLELLKFLMTTEFGLIG